MGERDTPDVSGRTFQEIVAQARSETRTLVRVDRPAPDRAVVRLCDPGKLNMLSTALVEQLKPALAEVLADPDVRAVVLTGTDPGFSAGGDAALMHEVASRLLDTPEGTTAIWKYIRYEYGAVARTIVHSDKAFVAAVNGVAAGVGLAWAFACDAVLCSDRAVLVPAFGRLGLLPEVGTAYALTRALGYRGALRYYVSGEHVPAAEAARLGLVDEVVPHDELAARADAWCDAVAALPPHSFAMTKPMLRTAADLSWDASIAVEEYAQPNVLTTREFREAIDGLLRSFG